MAPENESAGNESGPPPVHTTAALGRVVPSDYEEFAPGAIDASDREAVEALPPRSALLIVQHGPNAGARFLLDDDRVSAGRDTAADIFLDDVTVSRRHAEFLATDGGYAVRDVGSLNGTYVNRTRIDQSELQAGDEVQIGKYRLTFHPSPRRTHPTDDAADAPGTGGGGAAPADGEPGSGAPAQ
ncbi:FHA domain-containing protein [Occultella glacieicola]|uniref:FHA domain-containing protein n=1 Tax=Occultella glacieicola TaxID=2518684 RepID=A0ABY2E1S2_9MICO|nr:FHA domain-containing protein [Occultella glacieicola]TDE92563.1 FHA domain-containing protein [Occultella glacieicola]